MISANKTTKISRVLLILVAGLGFIQALVSAVRSQIVHRADLSYFHGIAWEQWTGVAVIGILFALIVNKVVNEEKEEA